MNIDRRRFLVAGAAASAAAFLPNSIAADAPAPPKSPAELARKRPPLNKELVFEFVRAGHNNLPRVKELLAQEPMLLNAMWDWAAGDWETALGGASHLGNRDNARFLLDQGARIDAFCAAMLGERDVVQALLTANPTTARAKGPHGYTLLYHVAISGDLATAGRIKSLLEPNAPDFNQALSAAVRDNHLDMMEWLLANGVTNPNQRDGLGKTPLALALEKGFTAIAEVLRRHGAREKA
jgi:hypothetical protein